MSDLATLLDYESHLEDALVAYFEARFPQWQVLTDRTRPEDEATLRTPRIEIAVSHSGNGTAEHYPQGDLARAPYESEKIGTPSIRARARRVSGQSLGAMRGALRAALLPDTLALTPINVPHYEILDVAEASSTPAFFAGNDEVQCELAWDLRWFIRPEAFPPRAS